MLRIVLIGLIIISGCTTPNTAPFQVWPLKATVRVGATLRLEANYANQVTGWFSSDQSIASVQNGIVLGINTGQVQIHAVSNGVPSGDAQMTVVP